MDEFASMIRDRAAIALRQLCNQEFTSMFDPVVMLVALLLNDEAGGVISEVDPPLTTEQWLTWSELALLQEATLSQMTANVLEREQMDIPTGLVAMQRWAACLVLSTLDQLELQ